MMAVVNTTNLCLEPGQRIWYSDQAARWTSDNRGSISGRDKGIISSPERPDRLWGPPSGIEGVFTGVQAGGA